MGNINPQYLFDNLANSVGVFLPIGDWIGIPNTL